MSDLPDSGIRTSFGDGRAVREADDSKSSIGGISPYALIRLGNLLTKANKKYGDYRNWEKGMPVQRFIDGMGRHLVGYMLRDESEDHLAAIMWNAMCLIHYEETGMIFELDNRPTWPILEEHTKWFSLDE